MSKPGHHCNDAGCWTRDDHAGREPVALPPTAEDLLRALRDAGGSLAYSDARVTTSGLTGLRHRGLARVVSQSGLPFVEFTTPGRERAASLVTP